MELSTMFSYDQDFLDAFAQLLGERTATKVLSSIESEDCN